MSAEIRYRVCPTCNRSVSAQSDERFCVNDGTKLLEACPRCDAPVKVEGAKFCAACGFDYRTAAIPLPPTDPANDSSTTSSANGTAPAPSTSWSATRRGRAAAILAILTIVGVIAVTWFSNRDGGQSFVGQIVGTQIFVGLTARGGQVFAYICDGQKTGQWFRGTVNQNGSISLHAATGASLTAQISSTGATGALQLPQRTAHPFTLVAATGEAGLYQATGSDPNKKVVAGWILLSRGAQRGLVEINDLLFPVPPLDPAKLTVEVVGVGQLEVRRADPRTN